MIRLLVGTLGALSFLSTSAPATTWIVDAAGGGQFTDIQTAILAAQPGDVLLVQPGTYAPFALDRGLTLIGYGVCAVSGGITIAGLPATQTAAVVRIEAQVLEIQSCDGTVLVQDMQQLEGISVSNSLDVRLARITVPVPFSSPLAPQTALVVSDSRVELVASNIQGSPSGDCTNPTAAGGGAASCANSRFHISRSTLHGGDGSTCFDTNTVSSNGGRGLDLQPGADAILCGRPADVITGGAPGLNMYYNDCGHDGEMGMPVLLGGGSLLRRSGVTIPDWTFQYSDFCFTFWDYGVVDNGGTQVLPAPADPTLVVSGSQSPGGILGFALDAPPGSTALLYLGRKPAVLNDPSTEIEVLTLATCVVNLGQVPGGGTVTYNWRVPSVLTPGVTFFAQAEVSVATGDLRRTNSIPVIVR